MPIGRMPQASAEMDMEVRSDGRRSKFLRLYDAHFAKLLARNLCAHSSLLRKKWNVVLVHLS